MANTNVDPGLRTRIPLYPAQFLSAMSLTTLGAILDSMIKDLDIPLSDGGIINGGLFLGMAGGVVLFNTALARVPAKWALCGATGLLGAGLVLGGAVAHSLWALFLAYLLAGLAGGTMIVTCWAWLSAHITRHLASSALAMVVFFGLAMMLAPLAVGQALERGGTWRQVLMVEGGIALVSALVFILLPLLDIPGRQNIRLTHLKMVFSHDRRLLVGMLGAGFCYTGAESMMNVWLPKFQIDVFASTEARAGLSVTLFWVGLVLGRLVFMALARRFSAGRLLLLCLGIMATFVVLLAFAPSYGLALGMAAGTGFGASASYGLISSYCRFFAGWQAGVALSLFILAGTLGSVALPYVMGPIASSAGFRSALALVAVPVLGCGLFALLIERRARDHEG